MNIIKSSLFLIFTIILVPIIVYLYGQALNDVQNNLLIILIKTCVGVITICYVLSEITKNCSQVDKIWSIIPAVYAWIVAYNTDFHKKAVLISIVITIWAIRLTYNFSRRGGYSWKFWSGDEDYRWAIIRSKPPLNKPFVWSIFNLLFISIYQNVLLLLITLPILIAINSENVITTTDYIIAGFVVMFVIIEFIADQQQWDFQKEKKQRLNKNPNDKTNLFVTKGLWSISRHPNFACEQLVWITVYFFSVSAGGGWINWTIMGALLLVVLFKGSSDFSEGISLSKYPDYANYQKKVSRFIPFIY